MTAPKKEWWWGVKEDKLHIRGSQFGHTHVDVNRSQFPPRISESRFPDFPRTSSFKRAKWCVVVLCDHWTMVPVQPECQMTMFGIFSFCFLMHSKFSCSLAFLSIYEMNSPKKLPCVMQKKKNEVSSSFLILSFPIFSEQTHHSIDLIEFLLILIHLILTTISWYNFHQNYFAKRHIHALNKTATECIIWFAHFELFCSNRRKKITVIGHEHNWN